jgi:hypothetical protein
VRLARGPLAGRDESPRTTKLYDCIRGRETGACQPRQRGAGLTTVGSYLRNAGLLRGGLNDAPHFKGFRP